MNSKQNNSTNIRADINQCRNEFRRQVLTELANAMEGADGIGSWQEAAEFVLMFAEFAETPERSVCGCELGCLDWNTHSAVTGEKF